MRCLQLIDVQEVSLPRIKTESRLTLELTRPVPRYSQLDSFLDESSRLRAFVPPFAFTSFFSPEDTLLCICAAEAALSRSRPLKKSNGKANSQLRIAELTSGSGIVGLHIARLERGSSLLGLDIDPASTAVAIQNATTLGLSAQCRFETADLWSTNTNAKLASWKPHLLVCNPPYVPEPPLGKLAIEAGAGPDGTAHLLRTIEIADQIRPRTMALSWCSLSNPRRVLSAARTAGYELNSLFIVVIADGEYSGSVHEYLRELPQCFINENEQTLTAVGPDGSARFAYLLMAGDFSRRERDDATGTDMEDAVTSLCEGFRAGGIQSLAKLNVPVPVRAWLLDRWDEVRLRGFLHGPIQRMSEARA